jgi:hypothetical protein
MQVDTGQFAALTDKVAGLEAEVARWRALVEPSAAVFEIFWQAAYEAGRGSITGPARRPRGRHLRSVGRIGEP